jgi:uncharacterized protein
MNNVDILKQGYQAFAEGDLAKATANWATDIVWASCTGLPLVKGDGISRGVQEVMENVFAKMPQYYDDFNIEITDFVDGGDKIVMVGFYTGIWKATGRKFRANATHTWTFKDGKAIRYFQAVDTAEIISPQKMAETEQELGATHN